MTIGSLFSGIGGLELGLEWAGLGPTLWQVESDPKCRAVLAAHWPEVERHDDVRTVGAANLVPVDLVVGGFPCQDVSAAGKGAGLAGARSGLWYEFARVVAECRPRFVVVENVANGIAWVDAIRGTLGRLGYASLPVPLAASDVGAPHERARVFVVAANALCTGREGAGATTPKGRARPAGPFWREPVPDVLRVVYGIPAGVDHRNARPRIAALGNAVVPQCAEVIGHVIRQLVEAA